MSGLKSSIQTLMGASPETGYGFEFTTNVMISICIGLLTTILICYYVWFKVSKGQPVLPSLGPPKPRFRKRDKVIFYGKKMIRRVRSFAKNQITVTGAKRSAAKKKQLVFKIARKLLQFKKENEPKSLRREIPASFLEADWPEVDISDYRLPSEVMFMLRSVRVLGHFEKPIFLELCRYMETRQVPAGAYLFRVGEVDDSIYVVQNGRINVYITEQDGIEHCVKEVKKGESIHSLLSILDVLTGHNSTYKTVSAVAVGDATVLRLPAQAFRIVLERYPESLVRVVQIIMVRLQRVTFMALHNYLGLSYELMNPKTQSDKSLSVHRLESGSGPLKSSPTKHATSDTNNESVKPQFDIPDNISQGFDESLIAEEKKQQQEQHDQHVWKPATPSAAIPVPDSSTHPVSHMSSSGHTGRRLSKQEMRRESDPSMNTKAKSDTELVPSDFDVACSRARVAPQEDDVLLSGSPPHAYRSISAEDQMPSSFHPVHQAASSGASPSKKSRHKRSESTENTTPRQRKESLNNYQGLDDEELLKISMTDIVTILELKDPELLEGKCHLHYIKAGRTLVTQGDQDSSLFFVVTGQLQVLQQVVGKETEERVLFLVQPGEIVGSLAILTGEPSFFTIRSRLDARVVFISKSDFYGIMKHEPQIVLHVGNSVVRRMSSFVRSIDFALDWMLIESGRALFRQDDPSDCVYIILNGRLRSVVQQPSGKKELVGEYGRGELVGIVEVLTQTARATTLMAVRDTELAQIPDELLNLIKRRFPQVVTRLIHLLGERILGSLQGSKQSLSRTLSEHPNVEPRPTDANLNTVAILAVNEDVPLSNFTLELQHNLASIGPTLRLTSDIIQNRLGTSALDSMNEYRLSSWLAQQEDIHRMVLYQCDPRMTKWTKRCITQADCILVVAVYSEKPTMGQVEKQMENLAVRAQKELILLHKEDGEQPKHTADWLTIRDWCSSHHHIRCPKRVFRKKAPSKMSETYRKLFDTEPDRLSDFSRLARFLSGTSIGLVLGGGGARGLAHIGIIKAMQDAGIPIDIVGGTSIGSFIAALWADEFRNVPRLTQRAREWSYNMASLWAKLFDLTYPVTSMFSGRKFNQSIEEVFRDRQIEDLWIPFFCVTTDLSSSKMRVHRSGSVWRYVRASMTLSGYLPPLCDPEDGHLLLDGGYVNNLPADVMKSLGAQSIFAVDVGSQDDSDLTNYGDELSGWWLLWKKWNPWAEAIKVPNMAEIQSRLAYVSCVRQLEEVKDSGMCEYIRPPIDKYRTLQFNAFDEIFDVGYSHGKALLANNSNLQDLFKEKVKDKLKPRMHKTIVPAEADFTDLAELISRIDEPYMRATNPIFDVDDEYEDDDDDLDRISVTSEPGVSDMPQLFVRSRTAVSEGASPASTPPNSTPPSLTMQGENFDTSPPFPSSSDDVFASSVPLTKSSSSTRSEAEQRGGRRPKVVTISQVKHRTKKGGSVDD